MALGWVALQVETGHATVGAGLAEVTVALVITLTSENLRNYGTDEGKADSRLWLPER